MSRLTVFQIRHDGEVKEFATVHNGMAGAPIVWRVLCKQLGLREWGDEEKLWASLSDPRLSDLDRASLVWTYDTVWVKRENITLLADMLSAFSAKHCEGLVKTIESTAFALRTLLEKADPAAQSLERGHREGLRPMRDEVLQAEDTLRRLLKEVEASLQNRFGYNVNARLQELRGITAEYHGGQLYYSNGTANDITPAQCTPLQLVSLARCVPAVVAALVAKEEQLVEDMTDAIEKMQGLLGRMA